MLSTTQVWKVKVTTIGNKDASKENWLNDAPALGQYADNPMGAATSQSGSFKPDIVTVSKDFKYPQVFRANLALEQMLPGDVKMTLEGIYSKTMNNVFFENLAAVNTGEKSYVVPGVEASAAPKYSNTQSAYYSIINLRNTNKRIYIRFICIAGKTFQLLAWIYQHLIPLVMLNQ